MQDMIMQTEVYDTNLIDTGLSTNTGLNEPLIQDDNIYAYNPNYDQYD